MQFNLEKIIETIPSGIVVLDNDFHILKMNPAFQKMFKCNKSMLGQHISGLLNADGFERIRSGTSEKYQSIQKRYETKYQEIVYGLPTEKQFVGIYSDISEIKHDSSQLDIIKSQTLMHAREFLEHQVRFAQDMAHYLGKSTAQSEVIAKRLIDLYEDGGV